MKRAKLVISNRRIYTFLAILVSVLILGGTYAVNPSISVTNINKGTQRTYSGVGGEWMASDPDTVGVYGGGKSIRSGAGERGSDGYITIAYSTIIHC